MSGDPGIIWSDDNELTELSLFVRTSDEELRSGQSPHLHRPTRETTISEDAAAIVARE